MSISLELNTTFYPLDLIKQALNVFEPQGKLVGINGRCTVSFDTDDDVVAYEFGNALLQIRQSL